jgi:hypothetical protein
VSCIAAFNESTGIHDRDRVAHKSHDRYVARNEQVGHAEVALQVHEKAEPARSAAASRLPGPAATGPGIVGLVVEVDPGGDEHDQDRCDEPVDD